PGWEWMGEILHPQVLDSRGWKRSPCGTQHLGAGVDADELCLGVQLENEARSLAGSDTELDDPARRDTGRHASHLPLEIVVARDGLVDVLEVRLRVEVRFAHPGKLRCAAMGRIDDPDLVRREYASLDRLERRRLDVTG